MTHNVFVTLMQTKTGYGVKAFILAGIGYAIWTELNRLEQRAQIKRLMSRMDKLEQDEGE